MSRRTWLKAPLAALILGALVTGLPGPAQAAPTAPGGGERPAAGSTPLTVRVATTEQIRAMAANGSGRLITLRAPAAGGSVAAQLAAVTCYLYAGVPYGGGGATTPIAVDGVLYCDDYVHVAVMTVELYRGVDRVANTTATYPFVSGIYATAVYPTCDEGVYVGVVGATVARYDLTPPSVTANVIGAPAYIGCAPPPPPSPAPLVVAVSANRTTLEGNPERLQMSASGGTPPYTWSATGLPTGLSINSTTGLISGTTTRTGGFAVTVTAVDAAGRSASAQFTWTVRRDGCPRC